MGNTDSTQKLGERVIVAKEKRKKDIKDQSQRYQYLKTHSPQTLNVIIQSVSDSLQSCSPFLESALLIAWMYDAEKCKEIILNSCEKVLNAPIRKDEYEWFKKYLFESSIWFLKTQNGKKFMYEELLDIAKTMSQGIIDSMDSIYNHLVLHPKWKQVMEIENKTVISRQDHHSVGLLQEKGLIHIFENKADDEEADDMQNFIDSNIAINILTSTAKNINQEFQDHIKTVMSHYGEFREGPIKKVERSVSKLENDYQDAAYPKCAKLLDLVRCSVTFNTVDQLIDGYHCLMKHILDNKEIMELGRVKNGFINNPDDDNNNGGYRDIKVNVVYKSKNNDNMICEVQLLLVNYLQEKKRIHKLYSIVREEAFFEMVVKEEQSQKSAPKDIKDLQFEEVLNVGQEVSLSYSRDPIYKCSMDSTLGLLGMEGEGWFGVVDIKQKKLIFSLKRSTDSSYSGSYGEQTHQWLTINQQKYISVQTNREIIKMFKVMKMQNYYQFIEDAKYKITNERSIKFCDFDREFEHIFLVDQGGVLQKRALNDINNIKQNIKLDFGWNQLKTSYYRNLRLSADGSLAGLAGGDGNKTFSVIDIENNKQHKLPSSYLKDTYVPCFINGDNQYISVGDSYGKIEIWDIKKKKSIKKLRIDRSKSITSAASTHNILAIGSGDKKLRLYDVRNWECFHSKQYNARGWSLHLTEDLKYVTYAGQGGDKCFVLQIE